MHKLVNGERVEISAQPEAKEPENTALPQETQTVPAKAAKIPKGKPMPLRAKLRTAKGKKSGK